MPPPRRAKIEIREAPNAKPTRASISSRPWEPMMSSTV
jgi:hypothetical protein